MRRASWPRVLAVGGALLLLLLLALGVLVAFQKGTRPGAAASVTPAVAATAAPSGVYREAVVGVPTMIDPLLAKETVDRDLSALVFSGLTHTDAQGGIGPDLARSWSIEDGGKRYVFTLRDGVTWHDGQRFTSRDVLFTIRLIQDAAFPGDTALADLWRTVSVETPDEYTVVCTLPKAYAPFLAYTNVGILPEHVLSAVKAGDLPNEPFNLQPIGTGPFRFTGLDPARAEVVLTRYDGYYGARPHLTGLRFRAYANTGAALQGVATGAVDGIGYIPASVLADAGAIADLANIYGPRLAGYTALFFNLKAPVFSSREVRQALALAVNREEIVNDGLHGWGTPGSSPILPNSWAYTTNDVPRYPYDPAQARQALDRAGWTAGANGTRVKDGQALAFTVLTDDDPARVAVANVLARQLAAIGCTVTVSAKSAADVTQLLASRQFEATLFGWEGLAGDPDPYPAWHSSQADTGYNFANYSNPNVDEALENARLTTDQAQRKAYYATFLKDFGADVPSLVLYYPQYHFAVTKRMTGVRADPLNEPSDRFSQIADWQLAPAR